MRRSKSVWLIACFLSAPAVAPAQQRPLPPLEKPESKIVPTLPSQFFDSARIASADFEAALAQTRPLTFRLRTRGLEACYQVRFRGERPEAARLTFPGEGGPAISALHLRGIRCPASTISSSTEETSRRAARRRCERLAARRKHPSLWSSEIST